MRFDIDLQGVKRQVENIKKSIKDNTPKMLEELAPYTEQIMTYYVQKEVYDAYKPEYYDRTYKLLKSIRTEVKGNTLYVYSDGSNMMTDSGKYAPKPYSFYVQHGYKMPLAKDNQEMFARDWVEMTEKELIEHFNQDGWIIKRIGLTLERAIKEGGKK